MVYLSCYLINESASFQAMTFLCIALFGHDLLYLVAIKKGLFIRFDRYPLGQGRLSSLLTVIGSLLLLILGVFSLNTGLSFLFSGPYRHNSINPFALTILLFCFLTQAIIFKSQLKLLIAKEANLTNWDYLIQADDPSLIGVLLKEFIITVSTGIAALSYLLNASINESYPDAICALGISCLICILAIYLIYIHSRLIIGSSIDSDETIKIKRVIEDLEGIHKVHQILSEILSPGRVRVQIGIELSQQKFENNFILRKTIKNYISTRSLDESLPQEQKEIIKRVAEKLISIEQEIRLQNRQIILVDFDLY